MATQRKAPSYEDDAPGAIQDGREGLWTKLELFRMDARFCEAVRREHLDHEQRDEPMVPERRRWRVG